MTGFNSAACDACDALSARLRVGSSPVIGVGTVSDEQDIVESFVRHNVAFLDGLLVVEHRSYDDTPRILNSLIAEGLPVAVISWRNPGEHQSERLTNLAAAAAVRLGARLIVPLDADEFLVAGPEADVTTELRSVPEGAVRVLEWLSYVPLATDDGGEPDPVRRIVNRRCREVTHIRKVVVGRDIAANQNFRLDFGSHAAFVGVHEIDKVPYDGRLALAHLPVRSVPQIVAKVEIARLTLQLVRERPSDAGVHYKWLKNLVPISLDMSQADLTRAATLYSSQRAFDDLELVRDPIRPAFEGRLRYSNGLPADPMLRLAALGQDLVDYILRARTGDTEGHLVETRLAVENESLRLAMAKQMQLLGEFQKRNFWQRVGDLFHRTRFSM